MSRLLVMIAICAVFAATILAGQGAAAGHQPKAPTIPVLTTTSGDTSVPVVTGHGGGRFRW